MGYWYTTGYKSFYIESRDNKCQFTLTGSICGSSSVTRVPRLKRKSTWKRFYKMFPGLKGKTSIKGLSNSNGRHEWCGGNRNINTSLIKLKKVEADKIDYTNDIKTHMNAIIYYISRYGRKRLLNTIDCGIDVLLDDVNVPVTTISFTKSGNHFDILLGTETGTYKLNEISYDDCELEWLLRCIVDHLKYTFQKEYY